MRLHEPAPRVSKHRPDVPRAWELLVARCLEREPGRRYQSADQMLTPDSRAGAALPVATARRRALLMVGGGLAAAVLLAVVLVRGQRSPIGLAPDHRVLAASAPVAADHASEGRAPTIPSAPAPMAPAPLPVAAAAAPPGLRVHAPARKPVRARLVREAPAAKGSVTEPTPPPAPEEPQRRLHNPDDVSDPFQ
jgi:hypothetical protein